MHTQHEALQRHRAYALVDTEALIHNYRVLSEGAAVTPHTVSIAVVKADAYGHGVAAAAHALYGAGCRHFAVATLEEALELSHILQDTPPRLILVLGYTPPDTAVCAAHESITLTAVSRLHAEALSDAARREGVVLKCHVAIDTGMNRIGLPAHNDIEIQAAISDAVHIQTLEGLSVEGMFTHFALSDGDYEDAIHPDGLTLRQYARYQAVYDGLVAKGLRPAFCHICNSAAAIRLPKLYPEVCFDGVRFGISLYGYGVSPAPNHSYTLRPVMSLHTHVVHIHTVLAGETVGYGGRYRAETPRQVATLPIGYADGFRRGFQGASVTIHTEQGDVTAPIIGRICMDQCMVDVTDLPVSVGDRVTLFGESTPNFPAPQTALEALSTRADTIPYEILCQITRRVPRIIKV